MKDLFAIEEQLPFFTWHIGHQDYLKLYCCYSLGQTLMSNMKAVIAATAFNLTVMLTSNDGQQVLVREASIDRWLCTALVLENDWVPL